MYLRPSLYLNEFLYFCSQQLIMRHSNMATNCTVRRVPHIQTDQHSLIQLNNHFVMIGRHKKNFESTFCSAAGERYFLCIFKSFIFEIALFFYMFDLLKLVESTGLMMIRV